MISDAEGYFLNHVLIVLNSY